MNTQLKDNLSNLQESVSQVVEKAKPYANQALEKSRELYRGAVEKLPENSRKAIGFTAVGLFIGFIGYRIGSSKQKIAVTEPYKEAAKSAPQQLSPIFKFLKLWMFYRLSF